MAGLHREGGPEVPCLLGGCLHLFLSSISLLLILKSQALKTETFFLLKAPDLQWSYAVANPLVLDEVQPL